MTTAPFVELGFNPTDLRPGDLPRAGAFLGSTAEALEAALAVARARMVDQMREEVRGLASPTEAQLLRIADLAWQAAFWRFRKVSAPIMADAYLRAYLSVNAGDVPTSVLYSLADQHAEKIGSYFHTSSREALAQGFNTLVNRRVPAKAAADRVLDAYGLTPRQMRGYTAATTFDTPVANVMPRSLKARIRAYVDKAFTGRVKKLSTQEQHNIDQQAQQYAWMWLQDKGRLSERAQKMWITARDERVCKVCGPLHRQKVGINERFRTSQGEFWTPGLHPNCRCVVRLLENRFTVAKALMAAELNEFNQEHPRGEGGRFSTKARTKTIDVDEEFQRIVAQPVATPPTHISYATQAEPEKDPELDRQFTDLVSAQPKRRGFVGTFDNALDRQHAEVMAEVLDPEALLDFEADLIVNLRTELATEPKRDRGKLATQPLGHTAWAVIGIKQLPTGDIDQLSLKDITFTTNEFEAAQIAGKRIQKQVEREIENVYIEHGALVLYEDKRSGEMYTAKVNPRDVKRVVEWYANTATSHWHDDFDPDFMGDENIPLEWTDHRGRPVDLGENNKMRMSLIGQNFELDQQDFEHYVVHTDRAPFNEEAVEDISAGANSKTRKFNITGDYELSSDSINKTQAWFYNVTTFGIEPKTQIEQPESE